MFERPDKQKRLDQISALLASPVPRTVPPDLARAAKAEEGSMIMVVFGVAFAAFGLLLGVFLLPWKLPVDLRLQLPDARSAPGRIVSAEATSMTINKARVMEYRFEFGGTEVPSGAGVCYTTGRQWQPGAQVEVLYAPDRPTWACPKGARSSRSGAFGLLVLIFPGIGISVVFATVMFRRQAMWLLREGEAAEFRVTAMTATNVRVNKRPQYEITLERADRPGSPPVVLRRSQLGPVAFARARLESRQPFYVLIDPRRPKRMLLVEML
jgi:hypothetical protein